MPKFVIIEVCLILALNTLSSAQHQNHYKSEESLRGALNAVTRKQRSLNDNGQSTRYQDLSPMKYRTERETGHSSQQVGTSNIDEEEDDDSTRMDFVPSSKLIFGVLGKIILK